MGQEESAPYVNVDMQEETYEMLVEMQKKQALTIDTNKPDSLLQRGLSDFYGLILLYFGTFVVCDVLRTLYSGEWTRVIWSVLGPWNAATGAPLISKLAKFLGDKFGDPVQRCQDSYSAKIADCRLTNGTATQAYHDCVQQAETELNSCLENTPQYSQCQDQVGQVWDEIYNNPLIKFPQGIDSTGDYCLESLGGIVSTTS